MKKALLAGLLLVFSAATFSAQQVNVLQLVGDRYARKPIMEMVARYGMPDNQMKIGKHDVYTWVHEDVMYFDRLPPLRIKCQLAAYVEDGETVANISMTGDYGACVKFIP
jgi:hypothetical protein